MAAWRRCRLHPRASPRRGELIAQRKWPGAIPAVFLRMCMRGLADAATASVRASDQGNNADASQVAPLDILAIAEILMSMSRSSASADVFHVVADAHRRGVLDILAKGEATVGNLVGEVGLSYSAVSQHLAILLDVGLVRCRPEGRQRLYRLNAAPLREVANWVSHYEQFWEHRLDRLEAFFEKPGGRKR
jgi:DNA-binding transcriptional ArsR family regulator